MASALYDNSNVTFMVAKPFRCHGKDYNIGDDFPREEMHTVSPEVLVRTRHLVPIVEDSSLKPKHFHREVKTRELAEMKLGLRKPGPVAEDTQVDLDVHHNAEDEFDAADYLANHKVDEVVDFVTAHPERKDEFVKEEKKGQKRTTLLDKLEKIDA